MVIIKKINWIKALMKSLNIDVILPWEIGLNSVISYGINIFWS